MIRLVDAQYNVEANIDTAHGNRATALSYAGHNILHEPGIPFLAPWANRMPDGFHADGRFYLLDPTLGNLQIDPATGIPIHGLLSESNQWEVVHHSESSVTSRLRFWRYPALMAQWPFAHEYEMTYRLAAGALECTVTIRNLAVERMPVAIGFHPYFTLPDVPREQWSIHVPAKLRVVHDDRILPTGELLPAPPYDLNSGYTGLEPSPRFRIAGSGKAIEIRFSPEWPVAIVWGPEGENFVCIEPMAAVTNGINLHHRGLWQALPWIAPDAAWTAGFSIHASGYCDTGLL